jgi:threonylcarbamoyladenosine tRNA methylthiotransferase CDKAL1
MANGAVLAGCLQKAGYQLTDSFSSAEVVILNTCAVKGPTEDRMIELARRVPRTKKLIIAGCLPSINPERLKREVVFDGAVGPTAGERIIQITDGVIGGKNVVSLENETRSLPELSLPRIQQSSVISIVPVSEGCLGACTYCCVSAARGPLRSYETKDIVERIKEDLATGYREIWITSQDTGCYGKDRRTDLAALIRNICEIEGTFKVRVGMMNINAALPMIDRLVEAFKDPKVFKFVHLPVQSGDDEVLRLMRRQYQVDDFKTVIKAFRKESPNITVATDIICGFPKESSEAFGRSLSLIEEVKPDIVNVSKFFARPKTAAAKMKEDFVPAQEIKKRSAQMSSVARRMAFESNKRWEGWIGEILIDEKGKTPGFWVGRNYAYKPIAIKSGAKLLGCFAVTRVVRTFPTYLEGRVVG